MNKCSKCFAPMSENKKFCDQCGYSEPFALSNNTSADNDNDNDKSNDSNHYTVTNNSNNASYSSDQKGGKADNKELTRRARESLRGRWGVAVGTYFVFYLLIGVGAIVPFVGSLAIFVFMGPLVLGISIFALTLSRYEKEPHFGQIFEGFNTFGASIGAYFLILIFTFLWTLLLYIPGVIATYRYSMTYFIIADNPGIDPFEAIKRSKQMMIGNKWKLFCLHCRFIGWRILCYLSFGIGFLWFTPYVAISIAKFYDDIAHSEVSISI